MYPPPTTSTERHPSIAHILKKKWHRTVRARVEEEKEREEEAWRDTGRRGSKDRLWQSAPRVVRIINISKNDFHRQCYSCYDCIYGCHGNQLNHVGHIQ